MTSNPSPEHRERAGADGRDPVGAHFRPKTLIGAAGRPRRLAPLAVTAPRPVRRVCSHTAPTCALLIVWRHSCSQAFGCVKVTSSWPLYAQVLHHLDHFRL